MGWKTIAASAAALSMTIASSAAGQTPPADRAAAYAKIDALFADFQRGRHVPGLVYGVVVDGQLAYVKTLGVQDTTTRAPVTPETVFRIASMSKNFTALAALKLRDAGKLSFDQPVETFVPEIAGWTHATTDAPRIRIRDLATHTAGFVTDDPWGDRQLPLREPDFSAMLKAGVPFSRSPGMAMEYSNFGYALLGRVVTNASGRPYADYIGAEILKPLGMASATYDIGTIPVDRRAVGYRWEDNRWTEEPALGPGAFGAMGGLAVSARDYAKYIAFVLSAWPPRDGTESPILKRSSVREIAQGANFAATVPSPDGPSGCQRSMAYGLGVRVLTGCEPDFILTHSGGLPGYGSNVVMVPGRGLGVFAFSNLTYAPTAPVVLKATETLVATGAFPASALPVSLGLQRGIEAAARIYAAGDVMAAREMLAMNFLLDRDAAHWKATLDPIKGRLGTCHAAEPVVTDTATTANVVFPCERGRLQVRIILAPTSPATIQSLRFAEIG